MDALKQARYGSSETWRQHFVRDGFLSSLRMVNATSAAAHPERMEQAEAA